jgi:NADH-quinone oxidoreductase subunit N
MAALPQWAALLPAILLGGTGLLVLVIDTVAPDVRRPAVLSGTATVGSLAALGVAAWYIFAGPGPAFPDNPAVPGGAPGPIELFGGQIVVDGMSLFFTVVFASVAALVSVASYDYIGDRSYQGVYYSLVLLAAAGMTLMSAANSLAVAFVALELSSLPSYALVAFLKRNRGSVEGSLKYFLVGALSSAILVYGISLVYGVTGSLQLNAVAEALAANDLVGLLGFGVMMVLGGFLFKTASVPFHFWAPEAYEGSPAPISAFLSSASKAAGFALLFRVFVTAFPVDTVVAGLGIDWVLALQVLAIATMTLGNFAAATQDTVKRMLAYSSVGHTGAFLFVALVEHWGIGRTFEDYNGLAKRAPVASIAMTVCLFSLAGLPVGGGFLSKFFLFQGAVFAGFWWLAAVGAVNSALSLFYYSRVVKAMWIEEPDDDLELGSTPIGIYTAVLAAAVLTVLALPAFGLISSAAAESAQALLPLP